LRNESVIIIVNNDFPGFVYHDQLAVIFLRCFFLIDVIDYS